MPIGEVTRGTTGVNRLRRIDRWIAAQPVLRRTADPLVVDLGYGASATTSIELWQRLQPVRHDVELIGIEIAPERVLLANEQLAAARERGRIPASAPIRFQHGGFEVPMPGDRRPAVIRALNVLRQYDEADVAGHWQRMLDRLQPGGLLVEGTCNEVGRIATWVGLDPSGPQTFTISLRLTALDSPLIAAERLPKSLIHRNVPGERIHALLQDLDRQWRTHAGLGALSPVQRWQASVRGLRDAGWTVLDGPKRWRLGELTVPYAEVAPAS